MSGLIDKDPVLKRLTKEPEGLQKEVARREGKHGTEKFTAKTLADVVTKENQKRSDPQNNMSRASEQRSAIEAM